MAPIRAALALGPTYRLIRGQAIAEDVLDPEQGVEGVASLLVWNSVHRPISGQNLLSNRSPASVHFQQPAVEVELL